MILSEDQIKNIILDNPGKERLNKAVAYNKTMRMHLYGDKLELALKTIDGYESESLKALRIKYAKSNKDLFARLGRNVDKIFSARGGSSYYNLSEGQNKRAVTISTNIRDGFSTKQWIRAFWKTHFLDDPGGIIFMEIGDGNRYPVGVSYPTYVCSSHLYDYGEPKGVYLDYVAFNLNNKEKKQYGIDESVKAFRIVDDANDYVVKMENETVTILKEHTIPNYFRRVPAILNSDIVNSDGCHISLYDDVLSLADEFLVKGSIKITHEFLHCFPKYWEYADNCSDCAGTGYKGADECESCKGTGKKLMTKVSDVKILSQPESANDPTIAPNVAGYVSPDKAFIDIAKDGLQVLEDAMHFTVWGTITGKQASGPNSGAGQPVSATQIIDELQPLVDRLTELSESAEKRHKFIMDCTISHELNIVGYNNASINYGRRYVLENPDSIWNRYTDARKSGAPVNLLDDMLTEFIESKYGGDPVQMQIMLKLIAIEPFVHNTVTEIANFPVTSFEKQRKSYYSDWLSQMLRPDLITKSVDELKRSLSDYVVMQSTSAEGNNDKTPLAVKLGVGGTQSLQLVLADTGLSVDAKKATLVRLFGLSEEDANAMVGDAVGAKPPFTFN